MRIFPAEHEEFEIYPRKSEQSIARLEELSKRKSYEGVFFSNMFTMTPPKGRGLLITGYFSRDSKRLILDYLLTKPSQVLWILEVLFLPVVFLAIYLKITGGMMPCDSGYFIPMCVFFYLLCAILIHCLRYIFFQIAKNKFHQQIVLYALY